MPQLCAAAASFASAATSSLPVRVCPAERLDKHFDTHGAEFGLASDAAQLAFIFLQRPVRLAVHASDLLLCSTETAVANLERESVAGAVHLVGDAMADVTLAFAPVAERRSRALEEHGLEPGGYLAVTAHRAGNVDDPERLARLVALLEALPLPAIFPVHPRTRSRLEAAPDLLARLECAPRLQLTPPLGYLDFLVLTRHARAILTDSGGSRRRPTCSRPPA